MLYHLLIPLQDLCPVFNVFRYITFRAIYAAIFAMAIVLFLGPWFIEKMRRLKAGQTIRVEGPKTHLKKEGTPSMGGLLIIGAVTVSTLLWANLKNVYIWLVLWILVSFGCIGLIDDLKKIRLKDSRGLAGRWKLVFQILISLIFGMVLYKFDLLDTRLSVPFFKNLHPDLGVFYWPFIVLVITGASNAVNLTDGLDGLAIGPFIICAAVYGLFVYLAGHFELARYLLIPHVKGAGEISIFCGALVGAGLGFLWYNSYPAEIFMGDVGSLSLGGSLGAVAVIVKQELLLLIVGGIFVVEALSVMLQVAYFKTTGGKRIFRMAPIHHHFELKGWPEPKVIVRFWILAVILGLLGVSTLKLR
ncbi:Phospho-N-acetylmuramoyl-pentapeptide- transferase [Dissulfuribacter thermophilus]|uniref:Phospho-N-acetylmuramoyl-pentapeptide-transferase n=1 Tax=Dissulfuribacter thermophilus TaxID=1156395 RepID=A0A1B9F496_9BACT|nr:phospho-N-acetylmuramoyl-pentapeptide-transferase [Dissulfuribacter thermophilus]OCC14750.1 Phospho-N-acetylmuramoyl-pentapeptide- transferase [Dissulfuribacter thermophilus]